ncbi:MAG: glycosyltransferase family 2 protein [Bacteroidales bacterium]|nr:glycosyltransferase family 2 protein [Bacteroidales bacterium]
MLSIVCPIYNEEKYIAKCIDSILAQDFPKDNLEVIFVDGMSNDKTREIVKEYISKFSFIRLIDNPERIVPYAMNYGIKESKGDIIIRLDAHAEYPTNYFSVLVHHLNELNADNVGAVCKTDVLNKNNKTLAIKEVLSNKFGVGNSTFRTGIDDIQLVDTVPFGCWKRDVFDKYGMYDVRLVRNQDIELNKRIIRGGGSIYIVPDTYCTYLARETYSGIAKNNYGNGMWNILTCAYTKQLSSLSLRHFIPLIFVLSLILPIIGGMFWSPIMVVSILSLITYIVTLSVVCIKLSITKGLHFIYLLLAFITLHISYGLGSLYGVLKIPFLK